MKRANERTVGRPRSAPPATALAAAIVAARGRARLTVEEAAARLGVSAATWWKWEQGVQVPRLPRLAAIATCLGVSVARLLR